MKKSGVSACVSGVDEMYQLLTVLYNISCYFYFTVLILASVYFLSYLFIFFMYTVYCIVYTVGICILFAVSLVYFMHIFMPRSFTVFIIHLSAYFLKCVYEFLSDIILL